MTAHLIMRKVIRMQIACLSEPLFPPSAHAAQNFCYPVGNRCIHECMAYAYDVA